jgi:hypothetical protein
VMVSDGTPGPGVTACHSTGGDGGDGGGGGSAPGGGGSSPTQPPPPKKKAHALALRRIAFGSNKKKVKAGYPITLLGRVRALSRQNTCQRRQKVAIQRVVASTPNAAWTTIDVAITNKKGIFRTRTSPAPGSTTFNYRARVNRTKRCAAALSKRVKVRAI